MAGSGCGTNPFLKVHMVILRSITILLLFVSISATGQIVDVPLTHKVYDFLDRMESKGYLPGYLDAVRPIPARLISGYLHRLDSNQQHFTEYEREELEFLLKGFSLRTTNDGTDSSAAPDRWIPLTVPLDEGWMRFTPLLQLEQHQDAVDDLTKRIVGFQLDGHAFEKWGYYFTFLSINESGSLVDITKSHSPEQGIPYTVYQDGAFEYNMSQASLSYDFGYFDLSLEQTMNAWGNEKSGSLILSTKPPSFPKVKFRARLASWLQFTFVHAELHSNMIDSARSYISGVSALSEFTRTVFRSKYLSMHLFEADLMGFFDVMYGESIVYSDRGPSLLYLLPVSFFKSGEHYNRDIDNTQMFLAVDAPLGNGITLSGSMFLDELSVSTIGDPEKERNQFGFSTGMRMYDLPVHGLELSAEYTRINPWVYSHKFTAVNYTNNGSTLGHWIGQNADLMHFDLLYRFDRTLNARVQYYVYRKGDTADVANQYTPPAEQFLFGRQRVERMMKATVSYQPFRAAFVEASFLAGTIRDDQEFVPYRRDVREVQVSFRYGIW